MHFSTRVQTEKKNLLDNDFTASQKSSCARLRGYLILEWRIV